MRLTILNSLQFSNQILVFEERGKPEYPEKNLLEQSREPTDSVHILVEGERSHHYFSFQNQKATRNVA